jgi:hypothetical protein
VDVIVSPYAYAVKQHFESMRVEVSSPHEFPHILWIPSAALPLFSSGSFNDMPMRLIYISNQERLDNVTNDDNADTEFEYYKCPIREWIIKHHEQQEYLAIQDLFSVEQVTLLARYIRAYHSAIQTGGISNYLGGFNIVGTGSLLLINDALEPFMRSLGLYHMQHYIAFPDSNPGPILKWVSNSSNWNDVDEIRRNGMIYVRRYHTVASRIKALDTYFETGKIMYNYEKVLGSQKGRTVVG